MDAHDPLIRRLSTLGPLKLWSVVVTILGDLCPNPGDRIDGPVLGRLIEPMGLSNQALRVALHRLKRDGWLESQRDGRVSRYGLTDEGRARSDAVRPRLYAPDPPAPRPVMLIIGDPGQSAQVFAEALEDEAILVAARLAICAAEALPLPPDALSTMLPPGDLPRWMGEIVAPPDLVAEYEALAEALTPAPSAPDPYQGTLIRLLALHHWRRLRLRHGDLPDLLLGDDWAGARARRATMATLSACPKPDIATLFAENSV